MSITWPGQKYQCCFSDQPGSSAREATCLHSFHGYNYRPSIWHPCGIVKLGDDTNRPGLTCDTCGGAVRVIASIEDPVVIKQILSHLERKAESKEFNLLPENRAPPQGRLLG